MLLHNVSFANGWCSSPFLDSRAILGGSRVLRLDLHFVEAVGSFSDVASFLVFLLFGSSIGVRAAVAVAVDLFLGHVIPVLGIRRIGFGLEFVDFGLRFRDVLANSQYTVHLVRNRQDGYNVPPWSSDPGRPSSGSASPSASLPQRAHHSVTSEGRR